ncbi:disease resistance protein RPM1-like [Tasmannia lanceolata]|uniref:disease resistance protein RPM1-like n=1 Tax=Tasmannia lanceolata TaxID=3420 RepID=UPI004064A95E
MASEGVVSSLINKLESLLREEAKLLSGVGSEVRRIKDELESIKAFLKDADARAENEEGVKIWVKQVRDVSYDIEEVLDEFVLRLAPPHEHGCVGFLCKCAHFIKNLTVRHRVATGMQNLQTQVHDISNRKDKYALNRTEQGSSSSSTWHDLRVNALFVEEAELVGINKPRNELVEWLLDEDQKLKTISVVGMGGLGKTTLVKNVYDNERAKGNLECYAWITVSESITTEKLLKSMVKEFCKSRKEPVPEGLDSMKDAQLIDELREYLQNKRYVIVLDDVWHLDLWEGVKYALPDCRCGSWIMITTRNNDVASSCKETSGLVYNLKPLPFNEAWDLFCKKAFQSNLGGSCPPELKDLSEKIIKRCGGLPLAIVTVGGLLLKKNESLKEWEKIDQSLGSQLETNDNLQSMKRILWLSYNDLPYYLKSCFLYLSIFPAEKLITSSRIIQMWVAEGFIEEKQGMTVEDVAEGYLEDIIGRSMVQVIESYDDGRVRNFRVHDFVREIVLSKSREENFSTISIELATRLPDKIRRLSLHKNFESMPKNKTFSHLRSFFMFGIDKLPDPSMAAFFTGFRLVKVLDLEDAPIEKFPSEITNLFHLRYLSLRNTKIETLPKSIGKLKNLETLNLKGTSVSELPDEILKLEHLRHLLMYHYASEDYTSFHYMHGVRVPTQIGCLGSLQKLMVVEVNQDSSLIKEVGRLTQLKRLGIIKLRKEDGTELCASIEKMTHLRSFCVQSIDMDEFIDLQSLSLPPPKLQRLYLRGRLEMLPDWIGKLQHLVKIAIRWSRLRVEPLTSLQSLPNLLVLELFKTYEGEELCFKAGGFQRLKMLELREMSGLNQVRVEEGAMPKLQQLYINRCVELKKVPFGIENLKNLKELQLLDMPEEFIERLREGGSEDSWKVVRIPVIQSHYYRIYIEPVHENVF